MKLDGLLEQLLRLISPSDRRQRDQQNYKQAHRGRTSTINYWHYFELPFAAAVRNACSIAEAENSCSPRRLRNATRPSRPMTYTALGQPAYADSTFRSIRSTTAGNFTGSLRAQDVAYCCFVSKSFAGGSETLSRLLMVLCHSASECASWTYTSRNEAEFAYFAAN